MLCFLQNKTEIQWYQKNQQWRSQHGHPWLRVCHLRHVNRQPYEELYNVHVTSSMKAFPQDLSRHVSVNTGVVLKNFQLLLSSTLCSSPMGKSCISRHWNKSWLLDTNLKNSWGKEKPSGFLLWELDHHVDWMKRLTGWVCTNILCALLV